MELVALMVPTILVALPNVTCVHKTPSIVTAQKIEPQVIIQITLRETNYISKQQINFDFHCVSVR